MRALAAGQELSHYRVISPLGAGGMGEDYLAEDLRLGRKVALEILSRGLTAHEDRVRRFRQEARTISALNHPNILNLSRDENLDYLTDGLTESLINNLSQLPRIKVMARSTVFRYKGRETDLRRSNR
jgi:serine/threonine protein kinase